MEVLESVKNYVLENIVYDENADLKGDTLFLENGIIDSTGILELVSYIEEEFDLVVEDDEMIPENLNSLENISAFIAKKAGTQ